jgi:hypothetical protein
MPTDCVVDLTRVRLFMLEEAASFFLELYAC